MWTEHRINSSALLLLLLLHGQRLVAHRRIAHRVVVRATTLMLRPPVLVMVPRRLTAVGLPRALSIAMRARNSRGVPLLNHQRFSPAGTPAKGQRAERMCSATQERRWHLEQRYSGDAMLPLRAPLRSSVPRPSAPMI